MLARDEADVGHELARVLEATQVTEFGRDDHGGLGLEAAEAADAVDHGLVTRRQGQG
jgi:hypothetical protein